MNQELSFSEVYWTNWFQIGGMLMFFLGIVCVIVFKKYFFKWDVIKAEIYCEVLNFVVEEHWNVELIAENATNSLNMDYPNTEIKIVWFEGMAEFIVCEDRPKTESDL